jgi:putative ABC transport system substrate-binding protein
VSIQLTDVQSGPSSLVLDVIVRAGFRVLLFVPLLGAEEIVGALIVRRKQPGEFPKSTAGPERGGSPVLDVRRRMFISLLGGTAVAWPLAALAEQAARVPRIGIVDDAPMWHSFRQALREFGYVEGQSINYEYRYSESIPERLAGVMGELVRRPVDLIAAYGTPPIEAAKAATTTIPIVMIGVGDPVRVGLVASLARPGGNVTGNTVLSPDLGAKRLQLLREAIPTVARVAYLTNPDNAGTLEVLAEMKLAAPAAGMALIGVEFGSSSDFDAALAVMLRERTEVLLVSNDPLHQLHVSRIIDFLAKNRIAGMFQSKEHVAAGGLIAYGASLPDLFRRAAAYAHRILQGAKPADLPVELPTKFDLAINLKTARALGLDLPPLLVARADEVIECSAARRSHGRCR